MNLRLLLHILGSLSVMIGTAMVPSLLLALWGEVTPEVTARCVRAFGIAIAVCVVGGGVLRRWTQAHARDRIHASEGFAVAALGWIVMAALGALPMWLCADPSSTTIPQTPDSMIASPGPTFTYTDAYFEAMSGFTTTGSSVFGTARHTGGNGLIEKLPRSFLFWRSLTHWLGGMGIVVLCLAILPALRAGGYQMFAAEVPGPTAERLRPRIHETAAILWGVYLLLSAGEAVLLRLGGMPWFDSLCHTFGTMATGGFSTKDASIGFYAQTGHPSALYFEIVIDVFMFLAGCNFLLHFKALHGEPASFWKDSEFRFYCLVLGSATLITCVGLRLLHAPHGIGIGQSFRESVFQVLSITTTTGFATADFNLWPGICRGLMVLLMFFGGCAGSTGGGLKQVRILVAAKYVYRELQRLLRPQLVNRIRLGTVTVEERVVGGILGLAALWFGVFVLATIALLVLLETGQTAGDTHLVTATTAVAATLNNIGPGLGEVGATANYGWMPASAKLLIAFCMLLGRLEVFSVIVVLLPLAWRK